MEKIRTPRTVALEIIELITRDDLTDEQKITLIAMIVQDYGEDKLNDNIIY